MPTRFSMDQLVAQANTTLPDNATQDISAADVRDMFLNFLATMRPAYGAMRQSGNLVKALTSVPAVLAPWSVVATETPPEMVCDAALGTITHVISTLGNAGAECRASFFIGVSGPPGADLTFTLYINGVASTIIGRVTTTGVNNVVTVVLTGLSFHASDTINEIRVASSANANFTFSNGNFRLENVPVIAF